MSGTAIKWARRQRIASVKLKNMLNTIAYRADEKGKTWASQQTLADDMGANERFIRQLLRQLELLGLIERKRRSRGRKGRLTDEISLPLHKTFDLGRDAISAVPGRAVKPPTTGARAPAVTALTTGTNAPLVRIPTTGAFAGLQPAHVFQGIEREELYLAKKDPEQRRIEDRGQADPAPGCDDAAPFGRDNVVAFGGRAA